MMNKIEETLEWTDDLTQGDVNLDKQVQEYIKSANMFFDAINDNNAEEYIDKILNELTEYARTHFASQENMMKDIDYPAIDEHQQEHKDFVRNVSKLLKMRLFLKRPKVDDDEYDERGIAGVIRDTADFIREWFKAHIQVTDKRLADYYILEYKESLKG